jgi:hypothetical protein
MEPHCNGHEYLPGLEVLAGAALGCIATIPLVGYLAPQSVITFPVLIPPLVVTGAIIGMPVIIALNFRQAFSVGTRRSVLPCTELTTIVVTAAFARAMMPIGRP